MLTNTNIWKAQIYKKFEKVEVWKFSHLKKSAITFAQGCTRRNQPPFSLDILVTNRIFDN